MGGGQARTPANIARYYLQGYGPVVQRPPSDVIVPAFLGEESRWSS